MSVASDDQFFENEAVRAFEREAGLTNVPTQKDYVGNRFFLKFVVGREAPVYSYALHRAQQSLSEENPFRGAMGLETKKARNFPSSLEANALLTLLTRSTREVSEDSSSRGYSVPYIPFQKGEDHQLAQPASHIVRGRRGVGKSTLIRRAVDLLKTTPAVVAVLDMQAYSNLQGDELAEEVLHDVCSQLASASSNTSDEIAEEFSTLATAITSGDTKVNRTPAALKRIVAKVTTATRHHAFVFLDDFHLIDTASQPLLLDLLHGSLKGANGWIKVAGLSALLNVYDPTQRKGLQVPGDAQFISLDLTLENPEAAEEHLRHIAQEFLKAVGYSLSGSVVADRALRRLVWATAGVPRDFLQMFHRAIQHAQRNKHSAVTLSDVNIAIGEFGQQKMEDLSLDARNSSAALQKALEDLEKLCLDGDNKVNGFLVRSDDSNARKIVQALSDLRMVHLVHQSITPDRAGERYEAYIIDYSIFTGFRRRPGVKEMVPDQHQFKASQLRALPKYR